MTDFGSMMDAAFERLKVQEACPKHVWKRPVANTWRHGRERTVIYVTRCKLCDAIASRPTLEQLKAEVIKPRSVLAKVEGPHRLCAFPASRNRVCALHAGHHGAHSFVVKTTRED